uniref:Uncharacterized protein n=1 Tax=Globodera pallida TaxID=36090 RepID=A0A183CSS7_GLOPA
MGRRTESEVLDERWQRECNSSHIACYLISCSSGEKAFFDWGCSMYIRIEDTSSCIPKATDHVIREHPSDRPWLCDCTFGKKGESVDMGPPDLRSSITKAPPVPRSITTTTNARAVCCF